MIQKPRANAGITELRAAVAALVDHANGISSRGVAAVASGGGWGYDLGELGAGRTAPRGIDWIRRGLITGRRAEPPGVFADPSPAGVNVQYTVQAIDGGFETDWKTPLRLHDVATKGCIPAAVGDPALIVQFPAGDGTLIAHVIVFEHSHGVVCGA